VRFLRCCRRSSGRRARRRPAPGEWPARRWPGSRGWVPGPRAPAGVVRTFAPSGEARSPISTIGTSSVTTLAAGPPGGHDEGKQQRHRGRDEEARRGCALGLIPVSRLEVAGPVHTRLLGRSPVQREQTAHMLRREWAPGTQRQARGGFTAGPQRTHSGADQVVTDRQVGDVERRHDGPGPCCA
jgi:hypothetical protein